MTPEQSQGVRLRQLALASAVYLIGLLLLATTWAFGLMPAAPAIAIAAASVLLNAGLFAVFRLGANQRFADPSLTKFQIGAALSLLMAGTYFLDNDRGIALTFCFVIFAFGVFRLRTREFALLTLYALACYALVVNLLMWMRPSAIGNVVSEWMTWLVLAAVLTAFTMLASRISALRERLRAGNRELRNALGTIQTMATRDFLTGAYNRAFFTESLARALAQRARDGKGLAVLFIDVDRFKIINDTLGHTVGDRALQAVASRLTSTLRDGDIVARHGGDEFVALLEDPGGAAGPGEVADRVLAAIREPLSVMGRELPLSVSVGIALCPGDGTDGETLLRCADVAMYRAKEAGRNKYRFFSKEMLVDGEHHLALQADLRRAQARGELRLLYQPKVSMAGGTICGAEALLRWAHPRLGLLTPDRFIAHAEDSGLIVPIGYWVLEEACVRAREWGGRHVAVNLSARQFRDEALIPNLRRILEGTGLPPARLVIEITESTAMHRPERALRQMHQIRELGVGLSMDDFGTGYSSLGLLRRFPFTNLKLDRAFVRELPNNASDVAITRSVIGMAHALGMSVTAEGVEHADQEAFLRREQCEEYQGYLCSPPVPEQRFLALAEARDATLTPAHPASIIA